MSLPVIIVENLSKRYRLGEHLHIMRARSFRDVFDYRIKKFFSKKDKEYSVEKNTLWALKDVAFEVAKGEAVGIIGRNGAGKSTLLKILSRITEPTTGRITIHGRVASLLEVGTGFSGELTGRENIFLNGSILGMKKAEIVRKFDEIVSFAEVDRFVDTPVKRYSSGMYVRLAFAVAAHLEPEILIVDEVLAVGDAQFQKKCLGKMSDVAKEGRTVLFVSHNMPAVTRLCSRAVIIHEGRLIADGDAGSVVHRYSSSEYGAMAYRKWTDPKRSPGNECVRLLEIQVNNNGNERSEVVDIRHSVEIVLRYQVLEQDTVVRPFLMFYNDEGHNIFTTMDVYTKWYLQPRPPGMYESKVIVPGNYLAEGSLSVNAGIATGKDDGTVYFVEDGAVSFQVVDGNEGDSARRGFSGAYPGIVRPVFVWETDPVGDG
jgi:lipopolysaccharide transport system ATP-binding protein